MALRLTLCFGFVFGAALTAAGQMTITLRPVNIVGDIVQVAPRSVVVKAGDNKNWTLNLNNNTRVKVTGAAVPEMITPRVCVRFIASIDKKTCKAQDKLDKVTIFTPTAGIASRTLGVEPAKDAAHDDDEDAGPGGFPPPGPPGPPNGPGRGPGRQPMPGQGPPGQAPLPRQGPAAGQAGADSLPGPSDPGVADDSTKGGKRRGAAGKSPAAAVPEVASYEVCAQVVSYHSRRLTVNVQNRFFKSRITADLSPDAEIAVDISDLSVAKPGDKVSASGYYITPGVCQMTSKLVVTLATPLGEKPGHSRRARPDVKADAAHKPPAKAKPEAAAAAKNLPAAQPAPAAAEEQTPAAQPAEQPAAAKELPKEKEGDSVMDDPHAKPAPKPDESKPDAKRSDDKKPPVKDDEKDVFEK